MTYYFLAAFLLTACNILTPAVMDDFLGKQGTLISIVGPMCSGKTTKVIELATKLQVRGEKVSCFCYPMSLHLEGNVLKSRNNTQIECVLLSGGISEIKKTIEKEIKKKKSTVLIFEEAAFLPDKLLKTILKYRKQGMKIIVSGMALDCCGEPFKGFMPSCLALSNKVVKLTAECSVCQHPAQTHARYLSGVQLQDANHLSEEDTKKAVYTPLCRKCHNMVQDKTNKGFLRIVTGPMQAGKSEKILRLIDRYQRQGKRVLAFTHKYAHKPELIYSRAGGQTSATILEENNVDAWPSMCQDCDVVVLDEAHFFGLNLVDAVKKIRAQGKTVIISGLDRDVRNKFFTGTIPLLLIIADKVSKITAICSFSKKKAAGTSRIVNIDKNPGVVVAATSNDVTYYPVEENIHEEMARGKNFTKPVVVDRVAEFRTGYIHTIYGPMASSKTDKLIRLVKRFELQGLKVLKLAHRAVVERDRAAEEGQLAAENSSKAKILSRNGAFVQCSILVENNESRDVVVNTPSHGKCDRVFTIHEMLESGKDFDVIAVDEAQFFSEELVSAFAELKERGKIILACGFYKDCSGEPFGTTMNEILKISDKKSKRTSICYKCKGDADVFERIVDDVPFNKAGVRMPEHPNNPNVKYVACCDTCRTNGLGEAQADIENKYKDFIKYT